MYRNGIKRLLAVVLSACGMICLSWLFLILAVAIKLDSPGPVFFKQKRVGIGKKHFYILKFRTMRIDTPHDMPTHLLHDPDQYITRMGHFLRLYFARIFFSFAKRGRESCFGSSGSP